MTSSCIVVQQVEIFFRCAFLPYFYVMFCFGELKTFRHVKYNNVKVYFTSLAPDKMKSYFVLPHLQNMW